MGAHKSAIRNVAVSPDSKYLATAGYDKTAKIWCAQTHKLLYSLTGHSDLIESVSFSSDSKSLFTASSDASVGEWSVTTGDCIQRYWGHEDDVTWAESSPCGKFVVSGSYDNSIILWERTGCPVSRFFESRATINEVKFSPDGSCFASVGNDRTLRIYSTQKNKLIAYRSFTCDLNSFIWSSPSEIYTGGDDGKIYHFSLETEQLTHFEAHNAAIRRLSYCPRKEILATGSYDKTIRLWKPVNQALLSTFSKGRKWENGIALSADGEKLFAASTDGHFRAYLVSSGDEIATPNQETFGINSIDIGKTKRAIGLDDHSVRILSGNGEQILFSPHSSIVQAVSLSPNEQFVASGSYDETLVVIDIENRETVFRFEGHKGIVNTIDWMNDDTLFSSGYDGCVYTHTLSTGASQKIFEIDSTIKSIQWNKIAKSLAIGSNDGRVRTVSLAGEVLTESPPDATLINELCWLADGQHIISAGRSRDIFIYDTRSKRKKCFVKNAHRKSIKSICVSRDGKYAISGSYDESIKIWDLQNAELKHQVFGAEAGISRVRINEETYEIQSTSWDGSLRTIDFNGKITSRLTMSER